MTSKNPENCNETSLSNQTQKYLLFILTLKLKQGFQDQVETKYLQEKFFSSHKLQLQESLYKNVQKFIVSKLSVFLFKISRKNWRKTNQQNQVQNRYKVIKRIFVLVKIYINYLLIREESEIGLHITLVSKVFFTKFSYSLA